MELHTSPIELHSPGSIELHPPISQLQIETNLFSSFAHRDKFGNFFKELDQNYDVNKMVVKAWNSMSNEDKQHYLDKASKRKAKHEKLKKRVTPRMVECFTI